MMKRLTVFALGVLLAMPVVAEEVDKTIDAASDGHVHVSNISGSVTINGWSRDQVEVTGEIGRNVEELIVERDGDKVTIKVKVPKKSGRGIESDLYINLPVASSIDVGTVSADIEVTGVLGDQELNTVSGDVTTEVDDRDVSAGSVSGDVEITGHGKDAETHGNTVSGDVTLIRVAGNAAAESVSGDVVVDGGSFDRAQFNTVNGDVLFRAELRRGGKLGAETVNGEVELQFEGEISARFDVETFNGDIDNCFGPKPQRTSKYTPGKELSFQEGDDDARVTVSTMNGDISICR
jgi:DUF4097 and DUF4098 domain-containing protein YvlB